ncbi:Protein CBG06050 [Caenorhabditis briggsae]|uniref:Protein CBG06050 n=1 Tax=Caenorhabditis briggsae TaxID=6238 RepID=A8X110_CAEBR|nr:Protein CBG06050 [Caenorhabditis briggsae]CAP26320.1 Protein CBG06050 [Caenorhabditis briggsae]
MYLIYLGTYSIEWPSNNPSLNGFPWEFFAVYLNVPFLFDESFEDIHTTMLLLFGLIQSAFLCNLFTFIQFNFGWGIRYARAMVFFYTFYVFQRSLRGETILIPKLPLRIHWKSITLITIFFFSTGYFIFPYTTNLLMYQRFYVYCLCIETSIWYFTKEFRMFPRHPRPNYFLFVRAYNLTVRRI